MTFPFGKAPFAILCVCVASGIALLIASTLAKPQRAPDLIFATHAKEHAAAYAPAIAAFEKKYGVKVQLQVVDQKALQGRLQSALEVGAAAPDIAELLYGTIGTFIRGPLADVQLVDLTDRVKAEGLNDRLVTSRFSMWTSRGRIFALPHDVHPVMLAYRRDLVEQLGIDVNKLTTWDEFCRVGRDVVAKSRNKDGTIDRYMLDLPADGNDQLRILLLQHGGDLFDVAGHVTFDSELAVDVVCWYAKQTGGAGRITFPCGWGQTLSRAMIDGLCLFYICPDWRSRQIEVDTPSLKGKLGLMPLPAWEPGGLRTSTWGGTGLSITKQCRNPDLAWKLAMYLYYDDPPVLAERFAGTNILPPLKAAWDQPQLSQPSEFWGGLPLGKTYAALAPQVPEQHDTAYNASATGKFSEAYTNTTFYYAEHGEAGLREFARSELKRCADRVRMTLDRNVFLKEGTVAMGHDGK